MANKSRYAPIPVKNYFFAAFLLVMVGVTGYFANYLIQNEQKLTTGATSGTAQLFFEPSLISLPPNNSVNIWATTDHNTAFVHLDLTFDTKLVKLTQEVSLSNPAFKKVISVTSMTSANSTGKVSVTVAADPTTIGSSPAGTFKIATLSLAANTHKAMTSALTFTTSTSQFVDTGATIETITAKNATVTLNAASPSHTTSPTPTPTATPTPTPTPSATPSI
jgi:hypothetical protein